MSLLLKISSHPIYAVMGKSSVQSKTVITVREIENRDRKGYTDMIPW